MLVDELVTKNITRRNITPARNLGANALGEYKFSSLDLFEQNMRHEYNCVCDTCSSSYVLCWDKFVMDGRPLHHTSLCGACRSAIASEKMKVTVSQPEYRQRASDTQKTLLATDAAFVAARAKGSQKRKEGWCKTEHAKQVAIGNLTWRYGKDHHNFNPNKTEFKAYLAEVTRITNKHDVRLISGYKPDRRGRNGVQDAIQLDHVVSIKTGFINGIDPELIGHICNLEFVAWEENRSKWATNTIDDIDTLCRSINKFNDILAID